MIKKTIISNMKLEKNNMTNIIYHYYIGMDIML